MVLELLQFLPIKDRPEIWKSEIPSFVQNRRLGRVRDTKFGTNVFNKILLNSAKCHGYSFYCFRVIKKKVTGGGWGGVELLPPPRLGLRYLVTRRSSMKKNVFPKFTQYSQEGTYNTAFF